MLIVSDASLITGNAMDRLYSPLRIGSLELPSRIIMAPMTRSRADNNGVPLDYVADFYVQRASAGLMLTEALYVSPMAKGYVRTPGLADDAQQAAWARVVAAVHKAGGRIFARGDHTEVSLALIGDLQSLAGGPSPVSHAGRLYLHDPATGLWTELPEPSLHVRVATYAGTPVAAPKPYELRVNRSDQTGVSAMVASAIRLVFEQPNEGAARRQLERLVTRTVCRSLDRRAPSSSNRPRVALPPKAARPPSGGSARSPRSRTSASTAPGTTAGSPARRRCSASAPGRAAVGRCSR
jgi:hypothetical protein